MALLRSPTVTLLSVALLTYFLTLCIMGAGEDGKAGGKIEIPDVKKNAEVQDLGRFCVEQYNESHRSGGGGGLRYVEVVEAQRQVVSGIKYYMKVEATKDGVTEMFDSVVVVKPWIHSKKLIRFALSGKQPGGV